MKQFTTYLVILTALLSFLGAGGQTITDSWVGGDGTKENPYQICDIQGLKQLAEDSKSGNYHKNEYFELIADIVDNVDLLVPDDFTYATPDIQGKIWETIPRFDGHLNGAGHSISGIKGSWWDLVVGYNMDSVYLINELNGSIKNLTILNSFLCAWIGVGGIDNSTIENCINYASTRYGFSCGWIESIRNSGNYGKSYACGIARGPVQKAVNCYNFGEVVSKATASYHEPSTYRHRGAGLFYQVYSALNCFNFGTVVGVENPAGIGWQLFDRMGVEMFSNIVNYGQIINMDGTDSYAIVAEVKYNYQTSDHKTHIGNLYAIEGEATNLIGDTNNITFSGSHSFLSKEYMQSDEFCQQLNANAKALGSDCCGWKRGKSGFPILDIINEEISGINELTAAESNFSDFPVIFYNLQGMEVKNPEKGIYIKIQGNKKEKIVL